ncbi:MAG: ribonuclease HII [Candidatus Izemoplasmatales bacterium]
MYKYELKLKNEGYRLIAGTDEVGRGPLAGGVLAAAVILDPNNPIEGLNDSKKLSEKKRIELDKEIKEKALTYAYAYVNERIIDEINIYQASKLAMIRAISYLKVKPEYILSDAMPLKETNIPYQAIIKGDSLSATIAAASIIAKVKRDEIMDSFALIYPNYGFEKHKGYPTKQHLETLRKYGPVKIHRKTYKPVKDLLITQK